jgi:hypothetical protein
VNTLRSIDLTRTVPNLLGCDEHGLPPRHPGWMSISKAQDDPVKYSYDARLEG